jgi:iron complex outermembrane receptor protein
MRSRGRLSGLLLASVTAPIGLAGYSSGWAQTSTGGASALDAIVVTARRRDESLQSVPVAVSAFTESELERREILSTTDLDRVTPNLQFKGYGPLTGNNAAAQVFIRGIGQSDGSSGVDPGVGLYIDEVYMGRSEGAVMDFRDTASVQVLRGPQGTLFGRNTIGGAVLLTSAAPGDTFGGTLRAGVGSDNLREASGAVDLPIVEGLAARVSAGVRERDGYVTRIYDGLDLGDENRRALQASLRWRASDALNVTMRGDYSKADEHGSPFVFAAINENQVFPAAVSVRAGCPGATFPPPSVPLTLVDKRCANDATWNLGKFTNGGSAPAFSVLESWGVSAIAQLKLSSVLSIKSITSHRNLLWAGARDADNTPFVILDTDYRTHGHQFSQEVQGLVESGKIKGVIGAYYYKENYDDFLQVNYAAPPNLVANGALPGSRDYQDSRPIDRSWALFSQIIVAPTNALSFTGGLRFTDDNKGVRITAFTVTPNTLPNPASPPTAVGVPPNGNLYVYPALFERTFKATTGSATAQYQWTGQTMTYASWSQGFKSGGFNQRENASPPNYRPTSFDPERATTYELGVKSELGGTVRLNGALFSTKYNSMQLIYRVGVVPLLFNAGTSSIDGGELELTYAPGDLIAEGSVGYLRNKFDQIVAVPGATATVGPGNELPFTPKWQAALGMGYAFRVVRGAFKLTPRLETSYTAKQFFDAANSPEIAQSAGVTVVNASLTLERDSVWRVTMGVDNLTNEAYRLAGNSSFSTAAGYAEVIYSRPRNWFARASHNF